MRRMSGAGREVHEERLVGCSSFLLSDPTDCFVGQRFGEVPFRILMWHLDWRRVLEERREPLVRLTALKPVEIVEPFSRWPTLIGAASTQFVIRRVVPFAKGGSGVLIASEHLRD